MTGAMVTRAGGDDFVGVLPGGYAWRFEPGAAAVSYAGWAENWWNPEGGAGFEAPPMGGDEDGDGVENGVEYLLVTPPTVATAVTGLETGFTGTGNGERAVLVRYVVDPEATGVRAVIELSADLGGWRRATEGEDVETVREGASVLVRPLRREDGAMFWRLVVEEG